MVDQTITKPLGLIKNLKLLVHGIPYVITFTCDIRTISTG
jgi:hypothetical protein